MQLIIKTSLLHLFFLNTVLFCFFKVRQHFFLNPCKFTRVIKLSTSAAARSQSSPDFNHSNTQKQCGTDILGDEISGDRVTCVACKLHVSTLVCSFKKRWTKKQKQCDWNKLISETTCNKLSITVSDHHGCKADWKVWQI